MAILLVTNSSVAIELVHSCSLPLSPPTHLEAVEVQETGPVLLRLHVTESSVGSSSHRRGEEGVSEWHTQVHTPLHLLINTPPLYSPFLHHKSSPSTLNADLKHSSSHPLPSHPFPYPPSKSSIVLK